MERKALTYGILTILAWSTVSTAFKISLTHMAPMQLIFISMLTASGFLTLYLFFTKGLFEIINYAKKDFAKMAILGIILFVYYVLLFMGYERLPAQIAQPINYTWAIVLTLLSVVFLKQKLSLKEFLYILLAYLGVVIIAVGGQSIGGSINSLGLICIIGSTILYPVYWLCNKMFDLPSVQGTWGSFVVASILSLLTLLCTNTGMPKDGIVAGIYVGLFELGIPFILWGLALRLTKKVSRIATLAFVGPFLSLFWINLIIKEPIAISTIIGICIIVIGTFLQQKEASKKEA